jgi:Protein of unknown function (DUF3047)
MFFCLAGFLRGLGLSGLMLLLAGCASSPTTPPTAEQPAELAVPVLSAWGAASGMPAKRASWQHQILPGKSPNHFQYARLNNRDALTVRSHSAVSVLRQVVHVSPDELAHVRFSWKVPELIAQADMARREADDSPVRIVLAFEGDRSRFSAKNAMLSELSQALTGEPMPYATLMYVWCNTRAPGSVILNPRTDRIRKVVVESGPKNLNQWLDYERDIAADFVKAFGEPPGALVGIGIMTDTDNTQSKVQAWYGPVKLAGR